MYEGRTEKKNQRKKRQKKKMQTRINKDCFIQDKEELEKNKKQKGKKHTRQWQFYFGSNKVPEKPQTLTLFY